MSKMWAIITNTRTKKCKVGLGNNVELYKKRGMQLLDVEQSYNGNWYIKGYAPLSGYTPNNEKRIFELKKELKSYDYIGVKIATGCATIDDYKDEIERCEEIRNEIRILEKVGG